MKKILILLLAVILLSGCSQGTKESTFMLTRDNILYALYNQDGKNLTDYDYKTFEEIKNVGYIVSNVNDEKGLISFSGKEIIPFGTYETIEAVDCMLYATKKVDKKDDEKKEIEKTDGMIKDNLYILDDKGEVLYSADEKVHILKSGLPVIYKDNQYIVLYHNGDVIYEGKDIVKYAYSYKQSKGVVLGFEKSQKYYAFYKDNKIEQTINEVGTFKILDQNEEGAILNDEKSKSMIYVDNTTKTYHQNNIQIQEGIIDDAKNIVLKGSHKTYLYIIGRSPVLATSYYLSSQTYLVRSKVVYGPHQIFKDGDLIGELTNCQLYPEPTKLGSDIFPVYLRDKGYVYYNFDNKQVIDKFYLSAEPFDENQCAIVRSNEKGYSLIDQTGEVLTDKYYNQIKYIGSSYYAVYNKDGMYGVIDNTGKTIFPIEYTTLPEQAFVEYDETAYLILGKNGRSYVYHIEKDMDVIFSNESQVVLNKKGYFIAGDQYYTFKGELIE